MELVLANGEGRKRIITHRWSNIGSLKGTSHLIAIPYFLHPLADLPIQFLRVGLMFMDQTRSNSTFVGRVDNFNKIPC